MATTDNEMNSEFPSPSPTDVASMGDAGRSLFAEVRLLREEHTKLTTQIASLCTAVRALVQMQSVLERSVKSLSDSPRADFGVIG